MSIISAEMQQVVDAQRLGFVATVCPDGTPNLSPKGTVAVWDADHLIFADIASPQTVANLLANPAIAINVVDPLLRKGFRFKGRAQVVVAGEIFASAFAFYHAHAVEYPFNGFVLIEVQEAQPLYSPIYDRGVSEAEVRAEYLSYWLNLWEVPSESPAPSAE